MFLSSVIIGAAVLIVIALVVVRRGSPVRSYGQVRRGMIDELAEAGGSRGTAPSRPPDLDCRIPGTRAEDLRHFGDPGPRGMDAFNEVIDSITDELSAIDPDTQWYELLSPARRAVLLCNAFDCEVNNGGLDQFYLNCSGDGAAATPEALRLVGCPAVSDLVETANSQFPSGPDPFRPARLAQMDALPPESAEVWDRLTTEFFDKHGTVGDACVKFILANRDEFFREA